MAAEVWTIGQGPHDGGGLVGLLQEFEIGLLADIRKVPTGPDGRPELSIRRLPQLLRSESIGYEYLGDELGGRPRNRFEYGRGGKPDYAVMAQSRLFLDGLATLVHVMNDRRTALLCVEESPYGCHRHRLVGLELERRGFTVRHIRADGSEEHRPEGVERVSRQGVLWPAA